jgi:hypothetical protein
MARLTKADKDALRKDKSKMSIAQLTEKYGVSKATVHRVLSGSADVVEKAEVTIPTMTGIGEDLVTEFGDVLSGRDEAMVRESEKEKTERPEDKQAGERLAEHLFHEDTSSATGVPEDIMDMVEDPVERTAVLQRIMLNLDNFGSIFTFIHDKGQFVQSLHSRPIADLKGILKTMETTRTTVNLSNQMKQTFLMVAKGTEVLGARFLNLKTDGFVGNLIAQKQELDMIFRELAIDYAPKFTFQTRPEMRLAMLYGMTLLQVDNTNRIKDFVESRAKTEVPEATAQTYGDI